jgi:ketosteroid isomerase-like protein
MRLGKTILLAALVLLGACRHTPDETRIREAIAATAKAAEAGEASGAVAGLTEDFDGNGGALDRRSLANMIRIGALRGARVGVTMGPVAVERRGERMVATFTATLTSTTNLFPDQLGLYRVETGWRKDSGQWKCFTATWSR